MTPVRALVPQPYRELLHRYLTVINAKRKQRGLRAASAAEVAGAMICFILDHHHQSIVEGYAVLRTRAFLQKFESFIGDGAEAPDAAATYCSSNTAEVPNP
jgi:hypothetical protein